MEPLTIQPKTIAILFNITVLTVPSRTTKKHREVLKSQQFCQMYNETGHPIVENP